MMSSADSTAAAHSAPLLSPDDDSNRRLLQQVHPSNWPLPQAPAVYDLVVIGGGTAGLVSAAGAAGLGAKVALIERSLLGGDCLNFGCVPSKALLSVARRIAAIRDAAELGIRDAAGTVDFPAVMERLRRLRADLSPHDSAARFQSLGVDVWFGQAQFADTRAVLVNGQRLNFRRAIIAAGSEPVIPAVPGLDAAGFLTNRTLYSLTELPARLLVIGGGPVGVEMAQAFARFGSQVTLVQRAPRLLPREAPEASELLQQQLVERDGIRLLLQATPVSVAVQNNVRQVVVQTGTQTVTIDCDRILVAAGRRPPLQDLQLPAAGIQVNADGQLLLNDRLQTSNTAVYAAGDVGSAHQLTHAADFLARTALQNSLFAGRAKASRLVIPRCTYCSPEIAAVGLTDQQAQQQSADVLTLTGPLSGNDRSILDGSSAGFVRLYAARRNGRILGATIVSEHAGELISEVSVAMAGGVTIGRLASVIHPYPTVADAIRRLGDQYNRQRLTPLVKRILRLWLRWRIW
ncbi:MAG: mercuric reductase [Planctomyces sp.]